MWWSHPKNKFLYGSLIQKISSYMVVSSKKKVHLQWSHLPKKVCVWWSHPKNKFICGGLIRKISMYGDSSTPYVRLLLGSVLVSSDFQYFHWPSPSLPPSTIKLRPGGGGAHGRFFVGWMNKHEYVDNFFFKILGPPPFSSFGVFSKLEKFWPPLNDPEWQIVRLNFLGPTHPCGSLTVLLQRVLRRQLRTNECHRKLQQSPNVELNFKS
jgi:hypothetical protein